MDDHEVFDAIASSLVDGSMRIASQHCNGSTVTLVFQHVMEPEPTQCTVTTNTPKPLFEAVAEFIGKPLCVGSMVRIRFVFEGDIMSAIFKVVTGQHLLFSKHDTVGGRPRYRAFSLELDLDKHHARIIGHEWDTATRGWLHTLTEETNNE